MRRRRFRHSSKPREAAPAPALALAADWRDEFRRLKDIEAELDRRMTDWAEGEQRYEPGHLLPSYSMDRKYDIFMEPRVPEIARKNARRAEEETPLVLEDPEEILEQVENAVRATDELRATAGDEDRRRSRKLLDPNHKRRKRGFFRRVFGGGKR